MIRRRAAQPDPMLLAPAWGSLWGIAFGTWILVPDIIGTHHIRVEDGVQSAMLLFALIVVFALTGAFVSFCGGFVLAIFEQLTLGAFRDRVWAYGVFTSTLVLAGYGLQDVVIQFANFRAVAIRPDEARPLVVLCLITLASAILAYRVITRMAQRPSPFLLAIALVVTSVAGAITGIEPTTGERLAKPNLEPLMKSGNHATGVPLLFFGIDGATWRVLKPAIESGKAPTLRSLLERGTSGDIEALWPPYWSSAAWASILTGLPRDTTGVYEDLAAIAPGMPPFQVPLTLSLKLDAMYTAREYLRVAGVIRFVRPPRPLLNGKPVWEWLHEGGVNSAVLRFPFTYPPAGQADLVVSDWVGNDSWEAMGVRHVATADAVTPPDLADQLLAPFRPDASDPHLFERLVPERTKPADAIVDPFEYLRASADVDERTFDVAKTVLRQNPKQPFLAIYIDGLDSAEHAFWQYRFPEDYGSNPPAAQDVKRFAPVIERYVQFIDAQLRDLLSLYQQPPNIIIVSDHGHGASQSQTGWRGWHTKEGIFLAAGPSVPKSTVPLRVSYYDVLPTVVSLEGLTVPAGLTGRPLFSDAADSKR